MKQVAQALCGTDTPVCALGFPCFGISCLGFVCALVSSSSRRHSPELEGAPPLVCKGGLLRSNATNFLISHLGFFFHESRFIAHESLPPEAHQ